MTKLITILIVLLALWGGWGLYKYWERFDDGKGASEVHPAAATSQVNPEQLSGLPDKLRDGLKAAYQQGAKGLRDWLKVYGRTVQDPRKAWIELDYCVASAREEPAEARKVFAGVKDRTPPSSPVWPRVKQLEKSYE